ncbi:MAG: TldD/PmbA family protein [Candidatus Nitrosocaldus sp.]|nr:TldD/PmbA family protein [Candidatus Nitrosocaldus sp.]
MLTVEDMLDACRRAVGKTLTMGADEAEAYMLDKEIVTVRLARSKVVESKGVRDRGLALRVVKDKSVSGASTSVMDEHGLERLAEHAISSAGMMQASPWKGLPTPSIPKGALEKGYDPALEAMGVEDLLSIAYRMLESAGADMLSVSGALHLVKEHVCIANSNGLELKDRATYIVGSVNADLEYDGGSGVYEKRVSGVGFRASRMLNSFDAEAAGREAAEMALNSKGASKAEEGEYSIIFEPYALGELLSFVVAYNFNSKAYQDGRSCFHGRIGDRIAVDGFSLADEPRRDDALGSKVFDDEGVETYNKYVVEQGVFRGIIYDTFYSSKDGVGSTGNALRAGYPVGRGVAALPHPSFHNIVVREGDYGRDEMIKDTRRGFIVSRLWYTYPVNPEQGDFSCTARSGVFEVRNGEIIGARRMLRIIDNLRRFMLNISAIGKEGRQILQWHAIPCITPGIRVEGIRVVPL